MRESGFTNEAWKVNTREDTVIKILIGTEGTWSGFSSKGGVGL